MYSVHICTVCSQIYRASSHIHSEPPMSSVISDSATCPGRVFLYLPESCVSVYLQHICVCVVCFCIPSPNMLCVVVQRKGKSCTSRINSRGLTNGKLGRFQKPVNPSEMVCTQMGMRKNNKIVFAFKLSDVMQAGLVSSFFSLVWWAGNQWPGTVFFK